MRTLIVFSLVLIVALVVTWYIYTNSESYLKNEVEEMTREYLSKVSSSNSLESLELQVEFLQNLKDKTHVIHQKYDLALNKDLIMVATTVEDLVFEWFSCPRTTDTASCELTK